MKTQNKALLIIALPLIGALYFAAVGIANKISMPNEPALTELGQNVSKLRQALEKEKETSGLFLGSKGQKFASELLAQRTKTNKQITGLKTFMLTEFVINNNSSKYGTEFKQGLSTVLHKLGLIETCRTGVSSRSIPIDEAIRYYTDLIVSLSDMYSGGEKDETQRR